MIHGHFGFEVLQAFEVLQDPEEGLESHVIIDGAVTGAEFLLDSVHESHELVTVVLIPQGFALDGELTWNDFACFLDLLHLECDIVTGLLVLQSKN